MRCQGEGNGPIDAFFNAIHGQKMDRFTFVDYNEHAITDGSDSMAVAYIHLQDQGGKDCLRRGHQPQHQPGTPEGHLVRHQSGGAEVKTAKRAPDSVRGPFFAM